MDYDEITDSYFVKGGMNLERGKLVLERDFSELGALQSAHTIRYCCESDETAANFRFGMAASWSAGGQNAQALRESFCCGFYLKMRFPGKTGSIFCRIAWNMYKI